MFTRKIIPAALGAAAVCIILFVLYVFSGRPPSIHWEKGARVMYRFSGRTIMLSSGGTVISNGSMMYGTVHISGILNLRVFDVTGNKISAGMQFSNVQIVNRKNREGVFEDRYTVIKGAREKDVEDLFSRMFYVRFSPGGRILGFSFSNEVAVEDRKRIEDLVKNMQVVIPGINYFKTWSMEEEDKYGVYSSQYRYDGKLVKQKKRYLQLSENGGFKNFIRSVSIKKSVTDCGYGYPDTWLNSIKSDELAVFYKDDSNVAFKISSAMSLEKIPYNPDRNLSLWANDRNPDADIAEWNSRPVERFSISKKRELDALNRYYGGLDFRNIVNRILNKNKRFSENGVNEILRYLNVLPEAADQIPGLLNKGLKVEQRAMLVNALQCNKSGHAQRALLRIIQGGEFPSDSRLQSAIAAGDIARPDDGIIPGLFSVYYNRNKNPDINRKLSDTAIISLGRIARTLSQSKNQDDVKNVKEIKNKISDEFFTPGDTGLLTSVIYAAGNTGDKYFIDRISGYLQHQTPAVRSAAAQSLSLFNDEGIDILLADRLKSESDIAVRTNIVKSLYDLKVSDESVKTVCDRIQIEQNDIVKGEMYLFLIKNREMPGIKDLLCKMLAGERSMENRDMISRAILSKNVTK